MDSGEEEGAHLNALHEAVWELAAIALGLRDPATTDREQRRAAEQVLVEAGLMVESASGPRPARGVAEAAGGEESGLAAQAATGILQSAALLSGASAWTCQDDEAILAQGRASAQGAQAFKVFAVPMMEGLGDLLSASSPVMLDVGVGVGAMAVAYCEAFPGLREVGLDVFPRALELAQRTIDQAGTADRIEVRYQVVAALARVQPRLAAGPVRPSSGDRGRAATHGWRAGPGGWLVVGHGKFAHQGLSNALTRFQTVAFGGTAINGDELQDVLRGVGLEQVATLPTPEGAPRITVGRRQVRS